MVNVILVENNKKEFLPRNFRALWLKNSYIALLRNQTSEKKKIV